jgi:hypothetical protein
LPARPPAPTIAPQTLERGLEDLEATGLRIWHAKGPTPDSGAALVPNRGADLHRHHVRVSATEPPQNHGANDLEVTGLEPVDHRKLVCATDGGLMDLQHR